MQHELHVRVPRVPGEAPPWHLGAPAGFLCASPRASAPPTPHPASALSAPETAGPPRFPRLPFVSFLRDGCFLGSPSILAAPRGTAPLPPCPLPDPRCRVRASPAGPAHPPPFSAPLPASKPRSCPHRCPDPPLLPRAYMVPRAPRGVRGSPRFSGRDRAPAGRAVAAQFLGRPRGLRGRLWVQGSPDEHMRGKLSRFPPARVLRSLLPRGSVRVHARLRPCVPPLPMAFPISRMFVCFSLSHRVCYLREMGPSLPLPPPPPLPFRFEHFQSRSLSGSARETGEFHS